RSCGSSSPTDRAGCAGRAARSRRRRATVRKDSTTASELSGAWRSIRGKASGIVTAGDAASGAPRRRRRPTRCVARSVSAAAATLVAAILGELALVDAHEVVAHLIEPRLVALTLDLVDARGGEGELVLLRGEVEVAAGQLVLAHVVVGIAR